MTVSVITAGDLRSLCRDTGYNNNDPNMILHISLKTKHNKEFQEIQIIPVVLFVAKTRRDPWMSFFVPPAVI